MKKRRRYTKEFKEGAVRLVTQEGRTRGDVAQSLGICEMNLSRWIQAAKEEKEEAFRGNGKRTDVAQENFELRKKIKEVEEEKEILKKAAVCFARHLA